jgi:hypothetical protein
MKNASIAALAPRRASVAALVFLLAMGVTGLAYDLTRVTIRSSASSSTRNASRKASATA